MKVNFLGSMSYSEDPDIVLVACGKPRLNHLIQDESLQSQLHQCEDVPSTRPQTTAKSRHSCDHHKPQLLPQVVQCPGADEHFLL